jgi:hypothetical protein
MFETEFMKVAQNVNRIMLQKSLSAVSANRNKKQVLLIKEFLLSFED